MADQRERAEQLRAMHRAPPILVLANAWDVASARIFARHPGCRALATTSSGVAASRGYADGEVIPPGEMLDMVARIARAVDVPLSADLEAGYDDPEATAHGAIEAGAVGLNLEDGRAGGELAAVEEHEERIRAVRRVAETGGVPLVVNARTDTYLSGTGDLDETVERGNRYLRAGADCVFVPGVANPELIGRLASAIDGPLNILVGPGSPGTAELERLGVARVSIGSAAMRATAALIARFATELYEEGAYAEVEGGMPFGELNQLLAE